MMAESLAGLFSSISSEVKAEAAQPKPAPEPKASAPPEPPTPQESKGVKAPQEPEKTPDSDSDRATAIEPESSEPKADATEPKEHEPKVHKIKVGGEEVEVSTAELIRNYQVEQGAWKRFQQANDAVKKAEGVLDYMRRDPLNGALQLIAKDKGDIQEAHGILVKAAIAFLKPYIDEQGMPPEMQSILQEKRVLDWQRRQFEDEKSRIEAEKQAESQRATRDKILKDIHGEMKKVGLDGDKKEVVEQQVISVLRSNWELGNQLTIPDAVSMVKSQLEEAARQYLARLRPKDLQKINPAAFESLNAATIEAAKQQRSSTNAATAAAIPAPTDSQRRSKAQEVSSRDLFTEIERQVRR